MVVALYVIVVYDVNVERINKVKKFLRVYLNWVQNSVFEGGITESILEEIKIELRDIIDKNEDSIIIYKFRSRNVLKKDILGIEKSPIDEVL